MGEIMQASIQKTHKEVSAYLSSLVWDGIKRLDHWLVDCAGAEDSLDTHEVSRMMLVDAVRRMKQPGCQIDQVVVLEGPQGSGKSSALRVLAGEDSWFIDLLLPLFVSPRPFMEAAASKWLVEASSLEDVKKGDVAGFKACLSRQYDTAYDYTSTQVARQFVIVGTTNETNGYLSDATGNRRFRPVRVQRFDLDRLRAVRNQLWAEAVAVEAAARTSAEINIRHLTVELDGSCGADDIVAIAQAIRRLRGVASVMSDLDEIKAALQSANARIFALKDKSRT